MALTKKKTKSGETRYYSNGKRLSKSEFSRRQKISKSRKKLSFKKSKPRKTKSQKSKKIPRVSSRVFTRKTVMNPDNMTEATVDQIRLPVNSDLMTSESDVIAYIDFIRDELISLIHDNVKPGQLFTLGYNFTFHWESGAFDVKSTRQQGFRQRRKLLSIKLEEIEIDLSELALEIMERFTVYMSRNRCIGVTLDDIILEVQHGKSRKIPKTRTR